MFEPLTTLMRAGEDTRSEAETERYVVDDDASGVSEDHKTEKNFSPRDSINEDNSILHRKGQMLAILFYSLSNQDSMEAFPYLEKFSDLEFPIRLVAINYDPSTVPVPSLDLESVQPELFTISSSQLPHGNLEKYSLHSVPKLLVVNSKGIVTFFSKPSKFNYETLQSNKKELNMDLSSQEDYTKDKHKFLVFFSTIMDYYSEILSHFIEYKIEFLERTCVAFLKTKTYQINLYIHCTRKFKGDAHFISNLMRENTGSW